MALVVLTAADERDAARFDASARRWAIRCLTAARSPSLAELRAVVDALDELPGLDAITALAAVCERLRLPLAARALDHLLPRPTGTPTAVGPAAPLTDRPVPPLAARRNVT